MIPMHKTDVSIILSVYNGEKTVRKMLDSVLAQTCQNWELIVVNDGSKDATRSIVQEYMERDPRIRLIDKANGGLGSARITGMKEAQGRYFVNVDADDWMEPGYVECLYAEVERQGVDILWCDVYDNDETLHVWRFNNGLEKTTLIRRVLMHEIWAPQWNRIVARDVALRNMQYLEGLQQWEDLVFNVACLMDNTTVGYLPKPLYHYAVNCQGSMTNTAAQRIMVDELVRAMENLSQAVAYYGKEDLCEYGLNYSKLKSVKSYIDDKRVLDYDRFVNTFPEAIAHVWEYRDYPLRLKVCAWLICHKASWLVPVACRFDGLLRRLGVTQQ